METGNHGLHAAPAETRTSAESPRFRILEIHPRMFRIRDDEGRHVPGTAVYSSREKAEAALEQIRRRRG